MMTRKALRASAKARQGKTPFLARMAQGEAAWEAGLPQSANPYAGTDDADAWDAGWQGMEEDNQ